MIRRLFLALLCTAACLPVLRVNVFEPLYCDRVRRQLRSRVVENFSQRESTNFRTRARHDAAEAIRCLQWVPHEIDFYMIAAANYRVTGRLDASAHLYQSALKYDHRPEIYINLGEVLLEIGQREEGLIALTKAASFYGDERYVEYVMQHIPERQEVKRRLRDRDRTAR